MGWPDRYSPVVSFSMCIRSVAEYSGMSGSWIVASSPPEAGAMPNKSSWPSTFCRRVLPMASSTVSYTAMSWDRLSPSCRRRRCG